MSQIDTWLKCCESSFTGHLYKETCDDEKKRTTFVIRGLYDQLRSSKVVTEFDSLISRDVPRTFPSKAYFGGSEALGQLHLYDVLHSFAQYAPDIGYCQGMNFVAGFLLFHVRRDAKNDDATWPCEFSAEETAFWLLVGLMRAPKYGMDGLYSEGLPRLFTSAYQIRRCVERVAPEIVKKLDALQVNTMTFLPRWLFSIFTTSIKDIESPEMILIWNTMFLDGWYAVVRIGVALIVGSKSSIMKFDSHDDCASFLVKDLFSRSDLLQMIRAGTMARDAICDKNLQEYAHEMMGLDFSLSSSLDSTKHTEKKKKSWLEWSVEVTSLVASAASDSLHRIIPDSILMAISSPGTNHRRRPDVPSSKTKQQRRPLRTALETIRAIKSALTQDRQNMFDVAIAELAPFPSKPSVFISSSSSSLSSLDVPVVEIRFGKECAHVPICDNSDEITDLTLVRLRELVTLSFPSVCTSSSSSNSSSEKQEQEKHPFIIRCRVQEDSKDENTKMIWIEANEDKDIRRAISAGMRTFEKRVAAVTTDLKNTSTKEEEKEEEEVEAGDAPIFVSASHCVGVFEVITREKMKLKESKLRHISLHKRRLFRGQLSLLRRKVEAAYRMIRDPNAAFWPKMLVLSALAYVVSPIDAIPDAIPALGLADDFAVLTALFASLASMSVDIEKYEEKKNESTTTDLSESSSLQDEKKNSTTMGEVEMTSNSIGNSVKRSNSNLSLVSEIDSDFDFDEFHDIEDDYVELEKSDGGWDESDIFL